ncbi:MAG: hypothetical protein PHC75_04260, partial [Burkholderiales bacterium]|nr:hypothetical protein [Burkholderiales bacterium]
MINSGKSLTTPVKNKTYNTNESAQDKNKATVKFESVKEALNTTLSEKSRNKEGLFQAIFMASADEELYCSALTHLSKSLNKNITQDSINHALHIIREIDNQETSLIDTKGYPCKDLFGEAGAKPTKNQLNRLSFILDTVKNIEKNPNEIKGELDKLSKQITDSYTNEVRHEKPIEEANRFEKDISLILKNINNGK